MMLRGIRGATTVSNNNEEEIVSYTKQLVLEMIAKNNLEAERVSHVLISVTTDVNAAFPAKCLRDISGWKYVPVMCMAEIDVPHGLKKCIRLMMVVDTDIAQEDIHHVFLNEAVKLRPDLVQGA